MDSSTKKFLTFTFFSVLLAALSACGEDSDGDTGFFGDPITTLSNAEVLELVRTLDMSDPSQALYSKNFIRIRDSGRGSLTILIQVLQDNSENTDVRKWAALLIGFIGRLDTEGPVLLGIFDGTTPGSYSWWHRTEAGNGLSLMFHKEATDEVLPFFEHQSYYVRQAAVEVYPNKVMDKNNRDPRIWDAIVNLAAADGSTTVRREAFNTIEELALPSDDIAPFTQILLTADNSTSREGAVDVLIAIGNPLAVEAFFEAIDKPETSIYVLMSLYQGFGVFQDLRALEILYEAIAFDSTQYGYHTAIFEALVQINEVHVVVDIQPILDFVVNEENRVLDRRDGIEALAAIGDSGAIPTLEDLRDNSGELLLENAAVRAIEAINGSASVAFWMRHSCNNRSVTHII